MPGWLLPARSRGEGTLPCPLAPIGACPRWPRPPSLLGKQVEGTGKSPGPRGVRPPTGCGLQPMAPVCEPRFLRQRQKCPGPQVGCKDRLPESTPSRAGAQVCPGKHPASRQRDCQNFKQSASLFLALSTRVCDRFRHNREHTDTCTHLHAQRSTHGCLQTVTGIHTHGHAHTLPHTSALLSVHMNHLRLLKNSFQNQEMKCVVSPVSRDSTSHLNTAVRPRLCGPHEQTSPSKNRKCFPSDRVIIY